MSALQPYNESVGYMIATIPVDYNVGAYASVVNPYGSYTQVGMPAGGKLSINNFQFSRNRVNYNASLIGGIPQTQELVDHCAANRIHPEIEIIRAGEANEAWEKVLSKKARYRYVIDTTTI